MRTAVFVFALLAVSILLASVRGEASAESAGGTLNDHVGTKTAAGEGDNQAAGINGYTPEDVRHMKDQAEQFEFQTEVSKVMNIIVNSLYSNKDVFLRELISNASDALDKIRLQSLTDKKALQHGSDLYIRVRVNHDERTIEIEDTGVGMTRAELVSNLGTIAKSGTKAFVEQLASSSSENQIGQFGVGFYSSFLVADKVRVTSRHNNETAQYVWESEDASSFSVAEDPQGPTLGRGSRITLFMRDTPDDNQYLQEDTLRRLLKTYSEFINFPIYLWDSKEVEREVVVLPDEGEEADADEGFGDEMNELFASEEDEDDEAEEEEGPQTRTVTEKVWDWDLVNDVKPLWLRPKREISEEDYQSFYKAISKDRRNPMYHTHFSAEGDVEFKALLFVPNKSPNAEVESNLQNKGVRLYVKRVFITDDFKFLIPRYLDFVKGVVDSDGLPLNVSREQLQRNKLLEKIRRKIMRKAISMFQEMGRDADLYQRFWASYGLNIKLGVVEDATHRNRLAKLLRFPSSHTEDVHTMTSLDDYVDRMKEHQDKIYYLAGEDLATLKKSPLVEGLLDQGFEVLFGTQPIDEYALMSLRKYDSKYTLVNVAKEDVDVEGDAQADELEGEESLSQFLKLTLKPRIVKAKATTRLTDWPCVLVAQSHGMSSNMQRINKAQAMADPNAKRHEGGRVLEINPHHPIIKEMNRRLQADKTDPMLVRYANLLYRSAAVASGYDVDSPLEFAQTIHGIMMESMDRTRHEVPDVVPVEEPIVDDWADAEEGAEEVYDEL